MVDYTYRSITNATRNAESKLTALRKVTMDKNSGNSEIIEKMARAIYGRPSKNFPTGWKWGNGETEQEKSALADATAAHEAGLAGYEEELSLLSTLNEDANKQIISFVRELTAIRAANGELALWAQKNPDAVKTILEGKAAVVAMESDQYLVEGFENKLPCRIAGFSIITCGLPESAEECSLEDARLDKKLEHTKESDHE